MIRNNSNLPGPIIALCVAVYFTSTAYGDKRQLSVAELMGYGAVEQRYDWFCKAGTEADHPRNVLYVLRTFDTECLTSIELRISASREYVLEQSKAPWFLAEDGGPTKVGRLSEIPHSLAVLRVATSNSQTSEQNLPHYQHRLVLSKQEGDTDWHHAVFDRRNLPVNVTEAIRSLPDHVKKPFVPIVDAITQKKLLTVDMPPRSIRALSHNGSILAWVPKQVALGEKLFIQTVEISSGKQGSIPAPGVRFCSQLAFPRSGTHLMLVATLKYGASARVHMYDVPLQKHNTSFRVTERPRPLHMTLSPTGDRVFVQTVGIRPPIEPLVVFHSETGRPVTAHSQLPAQLHWYYESPASDKCLMKKNGELILWDLVNGKEIDKPEVPAEPDLASWCDDGSRIAMTFTTSDRKSPYRFDVYQTADGTLTGNLTSSLRHKCDTVYSAVWAGSNHLIAATESGIHLWTLPDRKHQATFECDFDLKTVQLATSKDNSELIATAANGYIAVWPLE